MENFTYAALKIIALTLVVILLNACNAGGASAGSPAESAVKPPCACMHPLIKEPLSA